ncbi:MAG: ATP synthase F1 subunit epsilon [Rhodopirellula sp.]|nr:ATP synthase F1 subunit epsilon [Rhodopirellula sp.]
MDQLKCIVVTPERTVSDGMAEFVALPLYDGEIGIAARHSPMIGRLGYGELRIESIDATIRYYVEGGFVEVLDNVVSVLTNRAVPADELDEAVARQQLIAARQRPATSPELMAIRERAVSQARAQLRVAERAR